ncbi:MAG: hypothetical protein ABIP74_01895 [Candidatus Saccharimonas sp.]
MTRRYERGSVVGFVLVGVLLTAALAGGVWFARHPLGVETNTDSNTTSSSKTASEDRDTTTTTSSTKTTDEELKQTLAQQAAQSSSQKTTSSTASSSSSTTTSNKLPTTGPADAVFEIIGATMLSGVTVAYIRSRSVA